ncbi:Non-specific serine/threonine protein kinase [Bertholletia excelsa]
MDQFRQVGEVLGGIKALMVLKHDIAINQRQCCLLLEVFSLAFDVISEEIRQNLRLEERSTKWKPLENPLKELHRIFKEGQLYVKYCIDVRNWWGKAMSQNHNKDCVEFHIHNLLSCFGIVIEAIETAGEISGQDPDNMSKKRLALMRKYDGEWQDPKIFQWKFGRQYLISKEINKQLVNAWKEDRWVLREAIKEKKTIFKNKKLEEMLANLLLKKLNGDEALKEKLLPAWVLLGSNDYQVKRRLEIKGSHTKEIQWLGESFALTNFFGTITQQLEDDISSRLSLSHPNILQYHCSFYEEERKEGFLVMELMSKDLGSYINERRGQRKQMPFSLPVAVDILLQIARGMEYLHSQKLYHGDLNPSNILLRPRNFSQEGYLLAKITGFGLPSINYSSRASQMEDHPVIWYAPEVLADQEQKGGKCTEKADVYSFGMLCFEILTGKVPFEDSHLQEDKMGRNIKAGERPLFSFTSPKYLVNLTRKCWQPDPTQRPSFSAICRILRYMKRCLVLNPEHGLPESPPPPVDYCELEAGYSKLFPEEELHDYPPVLNVPFQLFAYGVIERERTSGCFEEKFSNLAMDAEDPFLPPIDQRSVCSEVQMGTKMSTVDAAQRSVCSETPADQKSVGSETPEGKFLPAASTGHLDQKWDGCGTPESILDRRSAGFETPDNILLPTASADPPNGSVTPREEASAGKNRSGGPTTAEQKIKPATAEEKSFARKSPEKKIVKRIAASHKSVSPKIGKRNLTTTSVNSETPRKISLLRTINDTVLPGNKEKKVSPRTTSDSELTPISSHSPKKENTRQKPIGKRLVCSEIPERKVLMKRRESVAKVSKVQGMQEALSTRSPPIWTRKEPSPKSLTKSLVLKPFAVYKDEQRVPIQKPK